MDWVDFFERSPEARTVMRFAQRAALTFTEAQMRLGFDDLQAEEGWMVFEGNQKAAACPQCGINPGDMDDEDGWSADEPLWKIERRECSICYERHIAMAAVAGREDDDDRTAGIYFATVPRKEGEPVAPRHDTSHVERDL